MSSTPAAVRRISGSLITRLRRRRFLTVFLFTILTVLVTGVHLTLLHYLFGKEEAFDPPAVPASSQAAGPAPAIEAAALRVIEGDIRKGFGFADSLREAGIPQDTVSELVRALDPHLDFRRLIPGERFSLAFDREGRPQRFTYETGPLGEIVLDNSTAGWSGGRRIIQHETRVVSVSGTIESSLFEELEKLGENDRLTMDFVDIFAWDIDFSNELWRGDTFSIVVEKKYRDGVFLTYGRILAAQYRDREELHQAFYFPYPEGGDYYTPEGASLRKTFLRAPVSYSRISSRYSRRRLHPILKKVQPHLGVDYAAPVGTPVWAPADGVVIAATRDSRNGRKIVLRHPNGYQTYFLHLSRFARGMRKGKKVRQKDVIGYVGSSGLSTGPHLDYRMKRHGRWRNPLHEKFPPGKPLPERHRPEFAHYIDWLTGKLVSPPGASLAALREGNR